MLGVSKDLNYQDTAKRGMPAFSRKQEIVARGATEANLLNDQSQIEFVIPTGDITKFMVLKQAPRVQFKLSQTSTGAGSSAFVLLQSGGSCINSIELYHGSQRINNIKNFDREFNKWLNLSQYTTSNNQELGCESNGGGLDFGTVGTSATTTYKISLPLLGLFSSMTQKALPLGLFKNAPLYLRVNFNKRARMTASASTNVAALKVSDLKFVYTEMVLDSMTVQQVLPGGFNEVVEIDFIDISTVQDSLTTSPVSTHLVPCSDQSVRGVLTSYHQADKPTRVNPFAPTGEVQYKVGGEFYPQSSLKCDEEYIEILNEVRKVKSCSLGFDQKEDDLDDFKTDSFMTGIDLNVYGVCSGIIDGVNTIGRDVQAILNFGGAPANSAVEVQHGIYSDKKLRLENGQAVVLG